MENEPSNRHNEAGLEGESSGERAQSRDDSPRAAERRLVLSAEELHARAPLKVGEVIDRKYKIRRVLGCGGQSWVFDVSHVFLGDEYALKLFHRDDGITQDAFLRAVQEAQIQRQIGHENIARVGEAGVTPGGQFYLVMELMPGRPLRSALIEHGSLEVHEVLSIALQIAEGLHAVHQKNIIHRDLKPENLFINPGNAVKIIDFGVAKMLDKPAVVTLRDLVLGTVQYMSPEQFRSQLVTPLSDIYTLGVIVFELLVGERLVEHLVRVHGLSRDLYGMGNAILRKRAPILHELPGLANKVPPYVSAFVNRCLAKKKEQRFESMSSVAEALRGCQSRYEKECGHRIVVRELGRPLTPGSGVVRTDKNVHGAAERVAHGTDSVVSPDGPTSPAPPSPLVAARAVQPTNGPAVTVRLGSPARAIEQDVEPEHGAGTGSLSDREPELSSDPPHGTRPREAVERDLAVSRPVPPAAVQLQRRSVAPSAAVVAQPVAPRRAEYVIVDAPVPRSSQPAPARKRGGAARSASLLHLFIVGGALGVVLFGVLALFVVSPRQPRQAEAASQAPAIASVVVAPPPGDEAAVIHPPVPSPVGEQPSAPEPEPQAPASASSAPEPGLAPVSAAPAAPAAPTLRRAKPASSSSAAVREKDVQGMLARIRRIEAEIDREQEPKPSKKPVLPKSGLEANQPIAPSGGRISPPRD